MGMVLVLRGATDLEIRNLLADPSSIHDFLDDDDEDEDDEGYPVTDLDKAWHGLHYLFTGTAWEGDPPLNFLVTGGQQVGEEDVGYGPARAFMSDEVKRIHAAVHALSPEGLRARFNPSKMKKLEISPDIWDRDPADDDTLGYLLENRGPLLNFLDAAVRDELGMLVVLS